MPAAGAQPAGTATGTRRIAMWMISAFVFAIPFEEIVSVPIIGSPTRLLGLLTVPVAVVALFSRGRIRVRLPTLTLLLSFLFVLWNLVSFYWSRVPSATVSGTFTYAQLLVFFWMVGEFFRTRNALLPLLQAFVLGCYVAFGIAAYNLLVVNPSAFRATGPFDANEFATILALGIPLAVWLAALRRTSRLRLLNLLYPLIATLGVVLGASRGGLLVALVGLATIPLAFGRLGMRRRIALLVAMVASVGFSFFYVPSLLPQLATNLDRLATTGTELAGGTLTGRTVIWSETLELVRDSPFLGLGSRAPRYLLAEQAYGYQRAVHNTLLSIAAETGIVGLVLFLGIVAAATFSALAAPKPERTFAVLLMAAFIVAMMPLSLETRKLTWFVLAVAAGQTPIVLRAEPVIRRTADGASTASPA